LLEPGRILVVWIIFVLGEWLMLLEAGIIFVAWVKLVLEEGFMLLEPWTKIDVCCRFVLWEGWMLLEPEFIPGVWLKLDDGLILTEFGDIVLLSVLEGGLIVLELWTEFVVGFEQECGQCFATIGTEHGAINNDRLQSSGSSGL
jgi:hypothetical protein